MELPPRARRILEITATLRGQEGTTSACAENTQETVWRPCGAWNYLRVRGEYTKIDPTNLSVQELPPRARRIRDRKIIGENDRGTTSACAENTLLMVLKKPAARNYLRVRGEYSTAPSSASISSELPPRARRIRLN